MPDVIYHSFDMEGSKESFANWISEISPEQTPFITSAKKFPVQNTTFQWQQDSLAHASDANAYKEGSSADSVTLTPTIPTYNHTQIFRKVFTVSDTANAVKSHGRGKELQYHMINATKELKRDVETTLLLKAHPRFVGSASKASQTASIGQIINHQFVHYLPIQAFEEALFDHTNLLFVEGAKPTVIMYHPNLATYFANLQEAPSRKRIFENNKKFVKQVKTIIDPLGQELACIPNLFMPVDSLLIYNPADVSIAILREPTATILAKTGSSTKWMLEKEIGLRLDNDHAAAYFQFMDGPEVTEDLKATEGTTDTITFGPVKFDTDCVSTQWFRILHGDRDPSPLEEAKPYVDATGSSFTQKPDGITFLSHYFCRGYDSKGSFTETIHIKPTEKVEVAPTSEEVSNG